MRLVLLFLVFSIQGAWADEDLGVSLSATHSLDSNWSAQAIGSYNVENHGITDTQLSLSFSDVIGSLNSGHKIRFEGGLSLPTGAFPETLVKVPHLAASQLKQTGSGTLDPFWSIHYTYRTRNFQFDLQTQTTVRITGNNSKSYHLGHEMAASAALDYVQSRYLTPGICLSARNRQAPEETVLNSTLTLKSSIPLTKEDRASLNLEVGAPHVYGVLGLGITIE